MSAAATPPKHLVTGIGASAGGLAAVRALLAALGPAPRMALVLAQHTAAGEDALRLDVLTAGAPMPVRVAAHDTIPESGLLTVVPAGQIATLARGRLRLRKPRSPGERRTPIDRLFCSIADDAGDCAVGVVLSGLGSDGALGLEDIAAAGGLALAQDPAGAARPEMPEAAIATGFCDHVLPPAELARVLGEYAEHLHALPHGMAARGRHGEVHRALPRIAELLRGHTGHDFRHYKPSTLVRRIERRMQVLRAAGVEDYLERLEREPAEAGVLFRELLIGVTAFFRDADAWESLASNVIAPLLARRAPGDDLRIWVPGCATGEEAYTLAMFVTEALDAHEIRPKVQIFATDLNERALSVGRRGSYPQGIALQVGPERLSRFFVRRGRRYQVSEALREMVVFSAHNLVSDPPFSRLDLISCRNLLIYLGPPLQKKLVPVFHYALKPGGYLFLGSSESLTGHGELFRAVDAGHKIGQRKEVRLPGPPPRAQATGGPAAWRGAEHAGETDLGGIARRILLDEFAPRYAIVNDEGQVLYLGEGTDKYLQPPVGGFSSSVVRMARRGLSAPLRSALADSARERRATARVLPSVSTSEGPRQVRLTVQPMPSLGEADGLFMVVLEDFGAPARAGEQQGVPSGDADATIEALERELARAREELERALQEQDAAGEELKSANEELLSMNEEMQSANEELEASKEEVQAANAALAHANADLQNLLRSTDIATIFLDARGAVRGFTPDSGDVYALRPGDVGRPLSEIAARLVDLPALDFRDMAALLRTPDITARHPDGRWFIRRVTGARDGVGGVDGALVSFIDITAQKRVEDELRQASDMLRVLGDATPDLIFIKDRDSRLVWANPRFFDAIGVRPEQALGLSDAEWHHDSAEAEQFIADDRAIMAAGETSVLEEVLTRPGGGTVVYQSSKGVIRDADGVVTGLAGVSRDITAERESRRVLERTEARLRMALDVASMTAWSIDLTDLSVRHTPQLLAMLGRVAGSPSVTTIEGIHASVWPEDLAAQVAATTRGLQEHGRYEVEYRLRRDDGTPLWVTSRAQLVRDADGQPLEIVGVTREIHLQKTAQQELGLSARRFRAAVDALEAILWTNDATGRMAGEQPGWARLTGQCQADYQGFGWAGAVHPDDAQPTIDAWNISVRDRTPFIFAHRVRRADGEWRRFAIRAIPVLDGTGEVAEWVGVHTDVTDRDIAEAAIRASEAQFRTMLDTMGSLAWIAEADGYITWYNRAWTEYTGLSLGDSEGWGWDSVHRPELLEGITARWKQSIETGQRFEETFPLRRHDGVFLPFLTRVEPVRDETDMIVRWVGTNTDVSVLTVLQDELEASAEQFRVIAETVPQLVWTARPDGFVDWTNSRWHGNGVVPEGRVLGTDWADLIHPDDLRRVADAWSASMSDHVPFDIEYRLWHGDGWRWMLALALPVRAAPDAESPAGRIVSWVGSATDIDTMKQLQGQLGEAIETKDALLHEVNHRVKNSLQLVTSLIALQIGQTADPRAKEVLSEARQRIAVVANLHQRLYSSSQHDRMAFGPYLTRLAEDTLRSLGGANITLDVAVADEAVLKLNQAVPLALIVGEVLTNAVKYAFPDGRAGTIRVTAARDGTGTLTVEVADDGIGLADPSGTGGLGTRIISALARQIRGETSLTSDGTGTRFRIVVPPERTADAAAEDTDRRG